MYDYDFKNNEESILKEVKNVNIKMDNNYYLTNFVLTEKNLLVFYDANKGNPIWGSGTYTLPAFYLLFKVALANIEFQIKEGNLYIFVNEKEINCYDFDLEEFLNR